MEKSKSRVYMLDILRGIAVIGMVFHHALVSAEIVFFTTFDFLYTKTFEAIQLVFVAVFLLVSGICTNYSRSVIKRGAVVTMAALIVTFATCYVMPKMQLTGLEIYFGILHMFGLSMLIYGLARKLFEKINPTVGIIIFTILFIGYYLFYKTEPTSKHFFLLIFGIFPESMHTYGDYYPLLPYFFLFITGTYIGKFVKKGSFPYFFYDTRCKFLEMCGKYTLWIYLIHQPVIYLVFNVISMIKG